MKKLQNYILVISFLATQVVILQGMFVQIAKKTYRPTTAQRAETFRRTYTQDPHFLLYMSMKYEEHEKNPRKIVAHVSPVLPQTWLQKKLGMKLQPNPKYYARLKTISEVEKGFGYDDPRYYSPEEHREIVEYVPSVLPQTWWQKKLGINPKSPNLEYYKRLVMLEAEEHGWNCNPDFAQYYVYWKAIEENHESNPRPMVSYLSPTLPQNWLQKKLGIKRPNYKYYEELLKLENREDAE